MMIWLSALALASVRPSVQISQEIKTFQVEKGQFMLNGKPFQILAGEMHPTRIPSADWRSRIRMAKAMGLNAVAVYLFWNALEPEPGKFNFEGRNNIARFFEICRDEHMAVLLRPGPYCCAEWEFGGFPYWLLNEPGMVVRTNNGPFLKAASAYFDELGKVLKPYLVTSGKGGPIVMTQVENEYGSYGNDRVYMNKIKSMLIHAGFNTVLNQCDGGSQLARDSISGVVTGVNGGSWPDVVPTVDKYTPGGPYFVPEFYPGWLDHWGEQFVRTDGDVKGYQALVEHGVSVSMYMFHGGTNFGFMNGSNYSDHLEPSITSYDYDAPLDESGRPTKKFYEYRKVIEDATGAKLPPVPTMPPTISIPPFSLTKSGSLFANLGKPAAKGALETFEQLHQAYGYVAYQTKCPAAGSQMLSIQGLKDFATVYVGHTYVGKLDDMRHEHRLTIDVPKAGDTITILVENLGRINYGPMLPDGHKGILGSVSLGDDELTDWTMYKLPFNSDIGLHFDGAPAGPGTIYTGTFDLSKPGDTFFDMSAWGKGIVFVNGHNLGRYWKIGPEQTLFVPGAWLNKGTNRVTVFEQIGTAEPRMVGLDHSILDDLRPEPAPPMAARAAAPASLDLSLVHMCVDGMLAKGSAPQTFSFPEASGRYLVIQTLSTWANEDFAALAEVRLKGSNGKWISRGDWKVAYVDSEETAAEDDRAEHLFDDDDATIWHSRWSANVTGQPHMVVIDLGREVSADAVQIAPRQGQAPGKVKNFRVYIGNF